MEALHVRVFGKPEQVQAFFDALQTVHPFIPIRTPFVHITRGTEGPTWRVWVSIQLRNPVAKEDVIKFMQEMDLHDLHLLSQEEMDQFWVDLRAATSGLCSLDPAESVGTQTVDTDLLTGTMQRTCSVGSPKAPAHGGDLPPPPFKLGHFR